MSPFPIEIVDEEGRIQLANAAMEKIVGRRGQGAD